jgi:hypothetical protein
VQRFEIEQHQIEDQLNLDDLVDPPLTDHLEIQIGSEDKVILRPELSDGDQSSDISFSDADRQIM